MPVTPGVDEAIQEWLEHLGAMNASPHTLRTYRTAIVRLQRWLAGQPGLIDLPGPRARPAAATLTLPLLTHYIQALQREKLQYTTLRAYIGITVDWLADLVGRGVIPGIPGERGRLYTPDGTRKALLQLLTKPRTQPQAPRIPSLLRLPAYYPEQVTAFQQQHGILTIQASLDARARSYLNLLRNAALIATLFCTGGRIAEVLNLDVSDVRKHGKLRSSIRAVGKGNKERLLVLSQDAQAAISQYLAARQNVPADVLPYSGPSQPLFISHGPHKAGHRLTQFTAWRIVREAADALADVRMEEGADEEEIQVLRTVSPHTFRHFIGQALLDEGADIKTVAEYLGHSSTVVTERVYARPDPARVIEEVDTFSPRASRSFRHARTYSHTDDSGV